MRSALEVYEAHIAALAGGDVDVVVADYRDDAVLAGNIGIGRGHDHIRAIFAEYLARPSGIEPSADVQTEGDVVFVTWSAVVDGRSINGADTFVIDRGLIAVHTGFIADAAVHS